MTTKLKNVNHYIFESLNRLNVYLVLLWADDAWPLFNIYVSMRSDHLGKFLQTGHRGLICLPYWIRSWIGLPIQCKIGVAPICGSRGIWQLGTVIGEILCIPSSPLRNHQQPPSPNNGCGVLATAPHRRNWNMLYIKERLARHVCYSHENEGLVALRFSYYLSQKSHFLYL